METARGLERKATIYRGVLPDPERKMLNSAFVRVVDYALLQADYKLLLAENKQMQEVIDGIYAYMKREGLNEEAE